MKPLKVKIPWSDEYTGVKYNRDGTGSVLIELSVREQQDIIRTGLNHVLKRTKTDNNTYTKKVRTIELSDKEANLLIHYGFRCVIDFLVY